MSSKLSQEDIIRLLPINDLLYTRTAPASMVEERTQKKSYAEGGSGTTYKPGSHMIVNLQTGVEFIDPQQSFLVFDLKVEGSSDAFLSGSALNLVRDVQITSRSGIELDRLEGCNLFNYHRIKTKKSKYIEHNLNGLMIATEGSDFTEFKENARSVIPADTPVRVMIPLRYLSPIFDSDVLMPPHIARGLRVDCTLEALDTVFSVDNDGQTTDPADYVLSQPYILADSYKMGNDVMAFINANFASKDTGLVYEYSSIHTTNASSSSGTGAVNIEVRRAVSMALDAFMVSRVVGDIVDLKKDSFASIPYNANDRYQWRVGSHYLPNVPVEGPVEGYAQYLYWANKLRNEYEVSDDYTQFVGSSDASAGKINHSTTKYCVALQRNNILDQSGIIINNTQTLAVNATLATGSDRQNTVFLRHLRRAIAFLENVVLET